MRPILTREVQDFGPLGIQQRLELKLGKLVLSWHRNSNVRFTLIMRVDK